MKVGFLLPLFLLFQTSTYGFEDPLVIAKRGDVAPGTKFLRPLSTSDLIFNALSPPVLTERSDRAAFVASLTTGFTSTENLKSLWFADLQDDGFYDLTLAAASGMTVSGLSAEDSNKVLDMGQISASALENTRNIPQLTLDSKTGKLAFVAQLNETDNLGNLETAQTALFIADSGSLQLVAKEGQSGQTTTWGEEIIPIGMGFKEIKYINDRLVFNSTVSVLPDASAATGLAIYENGQLEFPVLSSEINPLIFPDDSLPENTLLKPNSNELRYPFYEKLFIVNFVGAVAVNEKGAIVHYVSGSIPYPVINNSRFIDLLRYRAPGENEFRTLTRTWNTPSVGFDERTFISGFQEISMNRDNDVAVKVLVGEYTGDPTGLYPLGTPMFPINNSAVIKYSNLNDVSVEEVVVKTGDEARGYQGEGDKLMALQQNLWVNSGSGKSPS